MKRLRSFYTILFILISAQLSAQQKINIRIRSALDSIPIAGLSLMLLAEGTLLTSDESGYIGFSANKKSYKIRLSHVGYVEQKFTLTLPQNEFTIYMQPRLNILEEVTVSTGYQTISKERATGSFVLLDQKTLNQQVSTDILSRLENITNGLIVDRKSSATPKITIRGIGTILGNREPLIILDNFPYQGNIDNLNPNEVESITVLKDAAAASIWGARAGNGVIVITTKKALNNMPLMIELNTNVTIADKPNLFSLPKMSAASTIEVEQMLYDKGYFTSTINAANKPAISPVLELLLAKTNGGISASELQAKLAELSNHDVRNDYLRYQYQHPVNRQIALNLRAGNDKVAWGFSTGYDANTTNLSGSYRRLNLNLKNTLNLGKRFSLNSSVRYTGNNMLAGKLGYGELTPDSREQSPYTFLADANGNPLPVVNNYRLSYLATAGNGKLLDWSYYPLLDDQYNHRAINTMDLLANLAAKYKILSGLDFSMQYQFERQEANNRNLYDADSYFARNLTNVYTQISSSGAVAYKVPKGGILDLNQATLKTNNLRGQLYYDKTFGKHSITALAGTELQEASNESNGNRNYGYDDRTLAYSPVDYTTTYPSFVSAGSSYISQGELSGYNSTLNRYVSLYSNASYTFDKRYQLTLSARKDAANLFGLLSNEKWKPLWSAGVAWEVTNEHFYNGTLFNTLRLRATFGFSGNVDPARTAVTTITHQGTSPYTQTSFARFNQYTNPELRWEKIATTNLAIDFGLLNNRISGSLELYRKHATDLYGRTPVDYTGINVSRLIKNVAEISGKGLDFSLKTINTQGTLNWASDFNFNLYQDQVLDYYQSTDQASSFTTGGQTLTGLVGKPVYSILSYAWAGLDPDTGDPMGYFQGAPSKDYLALTGTATTIKDLIYSGPAMPTVYGTLGNSFTYKALSLQVRLSYKLGYFFRRPSINYSSLFSNGIGHSDYESRWTQRGDERHTNIPSVVYPAVQRREIFYSSTEVLVEKGDHVRLAFINLSYELQPSILKRLPVKKLSLYANAANLGILWRANRKGIDPDYRIGNLSNPSTYSIGLKTSF